MRMTWPWIVAGLLAAAGCGTDRTPTWAAASLQLEPPAAAAEAPVAFLTWTVYGPRWDRQPTERHFACAVVVDIELGACAETCEPCADCEASWAVLDSQLSDTDCVDTPTGLPTLTAIAMAPLPPELSEDERASLTSLGSFVTYAEDPAWRSHGWAISDGGAESSEPPITAWPAFAWPVGP